MPKEHKVNCKICGVEVITTDFDAWKKHNEICFRCNRKAGIIYPKKPPKKSEREKPLLDEKEKIIRKKYEELLYLRKRYFDFFHGKDGRSGVCEELEDYFGVNIFDAFDSSGYEFCEFFNMGEDFDKDIAVPNWGIFKEIMNPKGEK